VWVYACLRHDELSQKITAAAFSSVAKLGMGSTAAAAMFGLLLSSPRGAAIELKVWLWR